MWVAALAFSFAVFPAMLYSGRLYYDEGGTSPDGPGMAFVAIVYTAPVWITAWLGFVALFLVRFRGPARLLPLVGSSATSMMLAAIATLATLFCSWAAFARVEVSRPTHWPFSLYWLALGGYCQCLRAAAVHRSLPPPDADLVEVFD